MEIYQTLPHITFVDPNHYIGDWSNVYPARDPDKRTYLFKEGTGDCPAGCTDNEFWYFRVTDDIEYVGTFRMHHEPAPYWWPEASRALDQYYNRSS
jgi:hypothetical protein